MIIRIAKKLKLTSKRKIFVMMTFLLFLSSAHAQVDSHKVYTVGAYDYALVKQGGVLKLGPLPHSEVPPQLPKTFLEKDGSYGGGEAFKTVHDACSDLKKQISSGKLPASINWHIYLLKAKWRVDTYELHPNDFRIKHSVIVLRKVKSAC